MINICISQSFLLLLIIKTKQIIMKTIKTKINGIVTKVSVREFNGMYQIVSGPYALGIVRKDEVL